MMSGQPPSASCGSVPFSDAAAPSAHNLRVAPLPVEENKGCKALAYFIVFLSLFSLELLQQLLNWSLDHQPPPSPEHLLNCQSYLS